MAMSLRSALVVLIVGFVIACGSTSGNDAGIDAGSATAGGSAGGAPIIEATDAGVFLGARCDPTLALEMLNACGIEPRNYFEDRKCLAIRSPDGGALDPTELMPFLQQGVAESCAFFGAQRLSCMEPEFRTCRSVNATSGVAARDAVAFVALQTCSGLLGPRFYSSCLMPCDTAHRACADACPTTTIGECSECSWSCGRQFMGCARTCTILPDAGFLDGGM
ncbi:MAG: hypothetical protein GQE15_03805 [Archangiaceae bacterium]|nr:hypothetical protein [Archangiaceae bacterium]